MEFKFFREEKYIISGSGIPVPSTTPIGILKGYVDVGLVYNRCVPYRVIINGTTFESEVENLSYNEYSRLHIDSTMDVRLCAVVLSESRVCEVWNGIEDRFTECPIEFLNNREDKFFIEILKLPRW